jgi:hypothetical protein
MQSALSSIALVSTPELRETRPRPEEIYENSQMTNHDPIKYFEKNSRGWSHADFERQIREQMSEMFGSGGFDARRDIAAVVLNRWGHSYFAPPIGFFFGSHGKPAAREVLRKPHGRVIFAHSELQGNMNMAHAMLEGRRGALQAIELL